MSKYNVTLTETVVYTISVEATDEDEAYQKANAVAEDLFSNFTNACVEWATYPSDESIEEVKDND